MKQRQVHLFNQFLQHWKLSPLSLNDALVSLPQFPKEKLDLLFQRKLECFHVGFGYYLWCELR